MKGDIFTFQAVRSFFSESSVQRFIIVSMKLQYEPIHEMNALIATKHQKKWRNRTEAAREAAGGEDLSESDVEFKAVSDVVIEE